jgi:hypothetical protein
MCMVCFVPSTWAYNELLLMPQDIRTLSKAFLALLLVCYHVATRTGQTSPIRPHISSTLFCGFLWGLVV